MLKLVDLAGRADFAIGPLGVSPGRRLIEGPGGSTNVEPIVMKVFLLLVEARGGVVTRDQLFTEAWGGVLVGDDSLNRAIARIRKVVSETAPGAFTIETIPRTGYRLTGDALLSADGIGESADRQPSVSRRSMIASAAAVALVGVAGAGIWSVRSRDERRFKDLLRRGEEGLEYGDGSLAPAQDLRQAVAIRPENPAAQGLLAYALMTNSDSLSKAAPSADVDEVERAAAASLRLDPTEPNARLALIQLHRSTLDLAANEDRLRAVLATAPSNIFAMRHLWSLLQSAGRSHDALGLVERAIGVKPLAASNNFPLAQMLWIVGRTAEADRIIDRALQFWPKHRYVRFARFTILAFTGRAAAAAAMLDSAETRPQSFTPQSIALWQRTLPALDEATDANIANAVSANLDAAKRDPRLASQAVLALSALGKVDAAFEIANALLVFQAPGQTKMGKPPASSTAWRFTPWLFTPPAALLRADPRFSALCDGIGLTDYWEKRRIEPDFRRS